MTGQQPDPRVPGTGREEDPAARAGRADLAAGTGRADDLAVGAGRADLATRQAALVAALVAGAPVPPGFDVRRVAAARQALLRKRAGEVARHWPMLAAALGSDWFAVFAGWADGRPARGGLRDGWELARRLATGGSLNPPAAEELAVREAGWYLPASGAPRRRRMPALRWTSGILAFQVAGRIRVLRHGGRWRHRQG